MSSALSLWLKSGVLTKFTEVKAGNKQANKTKVGILRPRGGWLTFLRYLREEGASMVVQMVKHLPTMPETRVQSQS